MSGMRRRQGVAAWRKALHLRCAACGKQTSVTAGTILHGSKLPLIAWFWAVYLMATHSNGISALQLQKQLGSAPTSPRGCCAPSCAAPCRAAARRSLALSRSTRPRSRCDQTDPVCARAARPKQMSSPRLKSKHAPTLRLRDQDFSAPRCMLLPQLPPHIKTTLLLSPPHSAHPRPHAPIRLPSTPSPPKPPPLSHQPSPTTSNPPSHPTPTPSLLSTPPTLPTHLSPSSITSLLKGVHTLYPTLNLRISFAPQRSTSLSAKEVSCA